MASMGYCRHENTANELARVWDEWEDWDADESTPHERAGRERLVRLVREMHEQFEFDGTYDDGSDS